MIVSVMFCCRIMLERGKWKAWGLCKYVVASACERADEVCDRSWGRELQWNEFLQCWSWHLNSVLFVLESQCQAHFFPLVRFIQTNVWNQVDTAGTCPTINMSCVSIVEQIPGVGSELKNDPSCTNLCAVPLRVQSIQHQLAQLDSESWSGRAEADRDRDFLQLLREKEALLQEIILVSKQQHPPETLLQLEEERSRLEEEVQRAQSSQSQGANQRSEWRQFVLSNFVFDKCFYRFYCCHTFRSHTFLIFCKSNIVVMFNISPQWYCWHCLNPSRGGGGGVFLCGVCMFSPCQHVFPPATPASSHSPKGFRLGLGSLKT